MILFYLSFILTVSNGNLAQSSPTVVPAKVNTAKEVIKVYPTPKNQGSITVQSANETSLSFYLFDLEGNLIYQTIIKKNEKQTINGLTKGTYLYNAFLNDENLEGGKVELK
ncbi:MAG TPA: T9SS type A sorting domain-containing protein [Flavisolibacter sp.]|jgi:hypothetical protein